MEDDRLIDAGHFALWGYPREQDDLEKPLRLREATVQADAVPLRNFAAFFMYAADHIERHGSSFGQEHFCDFAGAPPTHQRLADIVVVGRL